MDKSIETTSIGMSSLQFLIGSVAMRYRVVVAILLVLFRVVLSRCITQAVHTSSSAHLAVPNSRGAYDHRKGVFGRVGSSVRTGARARTPKETS